MTSNHPNITTPITREDLNQRIEKAVAYFKEGYNCSQSVVAAFADLYGYSEKQAFHMAAAFGGGIGRMRQTCGSACGMFLLTGLDCGATEGADRAGKSHNYEVVQDLAEEFKKINGSLICAELLGLKEVPKDPNAEERTQAYYKKRPCIKMVETSATIFSNYLARQYGLEEIEVK